jgi:hypothetical protein
VCFEQPVKIPRHRRTPHATVYSELLLNPIGLVSLTSKNAQHQ